MQVPKENLAFLSPNFKFPENRIQLIQFGSEFHPGSNQLWFKGPANIV